MVRQFSGWDMYTQFVTHALLTFTLKVVAAGFYVTSCVTWRVSTLWLCGLFWNDRNKSKFRSDSWGDRSVNIATGRTARVRFSAGASFFLHSVGSTQAPIQWVPGVKCRRREADHSPESSAEVNCAAVPHSVVIDWLCTGTILPSTFMRKLRRDWIRVVLATIQSRTFYLLVCCLKTWKLVYTEL
jgi:hypothetical protein